MLYIANRMQARPNRVQTAVESLYLLMRDNITRGNMDDAMARKWFPFIGTLFLFIWFSNMIGYIPLPTNTHATFDVFGVADAAVRHLRGDGQHRRSRWPSRSSCGSRYHIAGIRAQGLRRYFASWIPPAWSAARDAPDLFVIEVISHFVRIISPQRPTVRQHPRRPPADPVHGRRPRGHPLASRRSASITLPIAVAFFIFEVGLVATLQAFIFATLTAIYLGGAVAEEH